MAARAKEKTAMMLENCILAEGGRLRIGLKVDSRLVGWLSWLLIEDLVDDC